MRNIFVTKAPKFLIPIVSRIVSTHLKFNMQIYNGYLAAETQKRAWHILKT